MQTCSKTYLANIIVRFKHTKTSEAEAIQKVIDSLSINDVDISCAKYYELKIEAKSKLEAREKAALIAKKVLTNPIIEDFEITTITKEGESTCELEL